MQLNERFPLSATKIFLWVVGLAVGIHYTFMIVAIENRSHCQANYNISVAQTITIRAELNNDSDNNQNGLILNVARLMVAPDPQNEKEAKALNAKFKKIFSDFIKTSDLINEKRNQTQFPKIPDCA